VPRGLRTRPSPAGVAAAAASLTLATALLVTSNAAAGAIGGASYKGPGRGDVDKIKFTVSHDGRVIGSMAVGFDSRCRQGGNNYTNKNTSVVFYTTKVRGSGKFKARDERNYPGGGDLSVARGRFNADGRSARGRFTFEGDFDPGNGPTVHCHAEGRFRATTRAKPEDGGGALQEGRWNGRTDQDLPIRFDTVEGEVRQIEFTVQVQCTSDNGSTFPDEHFAFIGRADVDGSTFEATQGPDHIRGSFSGQTASGVVSVGSYFDEFHAATCSGPGEIPFTAQLD
jgi:hypothetical protein